MCVLLYYFYMDIVKIFVSKRWENFMENILIVLLFIKAEIENDPQVVYKIPFLCFLMFSKELDNTICYVDIGIANVIWHDFLGKVVLNSRT